MNMSAPDNDISLFVRDAFAEMLNVVTSRLETEVGSLKRANAELREELAAAKRQRFDSVKFAIQTLTDFQNTNIENSGAIVRVDVNESALEYVAPAIALPPLVVRRRPTILHLPDFETYADQCTIEFYRDEVVSRILRARGAIGVEANFVRLMKDMAENKVTIKTGSGHSLKRSECCALCTVTFVPSLHEFVASPLPNGKLAFHNISSECMKCFNLALDAFRVCSYYTMIGIHTEERAAVRAEFKHADAALRACDD